MMANLKRVLPWLLFALGLLAIGAYVVVRNLGPSYPQASIPILNQAEQKWYEGNIQNYRMAVEIEFADEHRRHVIVVQDNRLRQGSVAYRQGQGWGPEEPLGVEQAESLTVPALFSLVRSAIQQELREDVGLVVDEEFGYPRVIYLGSLRQDGFLVPETEALITIVELEPLQASPD